MILMKEEHVTVELLFWRDINLNINNFGKTAIIAVFFLTETSTIKQSWVLTEMRNMLTD